jgi:hypothetical protein
VPGWVFSQSTQVRTPTLSKHTSLGLAHPESVIVLSSTQRTQIGPTPTVVSQIGVAPPQPASMPPPGTLSRQTTQAGVAGNPSHTPPVQGDPAVIGMFVQEPTSQRSAVHSFPSSQSVLTRQPTQIGDAPDVSQIGAPAEHPLSTDPIPASSRQRTHVEPIVAPLQTPPLHGAPAGSGVLPHVPVVQSSTVHSLPSSQ